MGIYGQCHKRYCFVTLTFNFKVTSGLLKVRFWPFFTFWPSSHIQKLDHPMAGIYNIYRIGYREILIPVIGPGEMTVSSYQTSQPAYCQDLLAGCK